MVSGLGITGIAGFTKIGDPSIDPQIVGSPCSTDPNKVPPVITSKPP